MAIKKNPGFAWGLRYHTQLSQRSARGPTLALSLCWLRWPFRPRWRKWEPHDRILMGKKRYRKTYKQMVGTNAIGKPT